ncbi:MAG TPA: hypothetical protein VHO24_03210 [Opitutaceae bacterium]|nr:hypothetical protein [Opitutaceae bacterium]
MTAAEIFRELRSTLAPKTVLVGVLVGFVGLCLLGRRAAREDLHKDFTRFTQWVSPETKYYVTVNEMMSIVRTKAKPGQILVIVGGNSVFRGVGQPPDQLWTKRLQENLGDAYCVVNFAFNGSGITDGGAVAAEALRKEFPKQIYMANAAPTQWPIPDGTITYRFVYWDAYHKGLLIDDPARTATINHFNALPPYSGGFKELTMREQLDRWFYFQDYWNDVTFAQFNTVWGFYTLGPTKFLRARKTYPDPEPDFLKMTMATRYLEANLEAEMVNVRGCSVYAYNKDADGKWQPYAPIWDQFTEYIKSTVPAELKKRTLIVLSRNSPYYIERLAPDERERDNLAYVDAVKKWKEGGYESIDYGRDFLIEDYGDRTHLTWQGGAKLSGIIADKVREMSQNLGYLPAK